MTLIIGPLEQRLRRDTLSLSFLNQKELRMVRRMHVVQCEERADDYFVRFLGLCFPQDPLCQHTEKKMPVMIEGNLLYLPSSFCSFAGLRHTVVIMGYGDRVELMHPRYVALHQDSNQWKHLEQLCLPYATNAATTSGDKR